MEAKPMTKDAVLNDGPAAEAIVDQVRDRYGAIARENQSGCCAPSCCGGDGGAGKTTGSQALGYSAEALAEIPDGADLALGCGAPLDGLELQPGETVVDLGSGGGIDAFLAARRVGPTGRVIGVDMTPEMLERARAAAERGGFANVEFRQGRLEALPIEDASVDAVTSNCVINLVPDKRAVFREVARVLRPGGRLVISDIVLAQPLPEAVSKDLMAWVGCVAGAELKDDYFAHLTDAGLGRVEFIKDVDALALYRDVVPKEALELLDRTGVKPEDLVGRVRSVTYRAFKTA
jgi:SAM-dependent methyltransferase